MFPGLKKKIPLNHFIFELTQKCNHDCLYCYNVWKKDKSFPGGELSTEQLKELFLKLKDETKLDLISFSGGEPLLRNDVPELIDFLSQNEIGSNLITNGTLLTDTVASACVENGVSLVEVSLLSSDRRVHKDLTQRDSLDDVLAGMTSVKNAGGKLIAGIVGTSKNIDDVKETAELAIAVGCDGIMFNRFNPGGEGLKHMDLLPSKEQLESALEQLNDLSGEYNLPVSCSVPIQPCVIDVSQYENLSHGFCPSGNKRAYYTVGSSGDMRVCNHSPSLLGNLLEKSFSEILENGFVEEFKTALPSHCKSCEKAHVCWGGCKASAQVCYGSLCEPEPFLKKNI